MTTQIQTRLIKWCVPCLAVAVLSFTSTISIADVKTRETSPQAQNKEVLELQKKELKGTTTLQMNKSTDSTNKDQ